MKRRIVFLVVVVFMAAGLFGQDITPTPTPTRKRGWLGRILHPFSPNVVPQYKDPRLRGLALDLQITPQTVKLSEIRQISVKVTLANLSKRPVALDFQTSQRIEIYLTNSAGEVLTKWSENHAIVEKPATILVNPSERIRVRRNNLHSRAYAKQGVYRRGFLSSILGAASSAKVPGGAVMGVMELLESWLLNFNTPRLNCRCFPTITRTRRVIGLQRYTQALLQPWADSARRVGLKDIAFTDHDRYHAGIEFDEIDRMRERNQDLRIRAGIELDNDPIHSAAGRRWIEQHWDKLDFVLGSVHFLDRADQMFDSVPEGAAQLDGRNIDAIYADYFRRIRELVRDRAGRLSCPFGFNQDPRSSPERGHRQFDR